MIGPCNCPIAGIGLQPTVRLPALSDQTFAVNKSKIKQFVHYSHLKKL